MQQPNDWSTVARKPLAHIWFDCNEPATTLPSFVSVSSVSHLVALLLSLHAAPVDTTSYSFVGGCGCRNARYSLFWLYQSPHYISLYRQKRNGIRELNRMSGFFYLTLLLLALKIFRMKCIAQLITRVEHSQLLQPSLLTVSLSSNLQITGLRKRKNKNRSFRLISCISAHHHHHLLSFLVFVTKRTRQPFSSSHSIKIDRFPVCFRHKNITISNRFSQTRTVRSIDSVVSSFLHSTNFHYIFFVFVYFFFKVHFTQNQKPNEIGSARINWKWK